MSMPFFGKEFTFRQPDGTHLEVRGWGNQHHAVFETMDGYTVVQDPATGYFQYARSSDDGEDLEPTGARPGITNPQTLGLNKGVRMTHAAAKARGMESAGLPRGGSRWEQRRREARNAMRAAVAAPGIAGAPPTRTTVGNYVGLCLLVQFPDMPGTIKREEVEAFCNKQGYNGFGNKGSVRDYFFDESSGKLGYTSVVTPYYTAKHPRAYYTNEAVAQPIRARELIKEALTYWKQKGFNFSSLTTDNANNIYAVNLFYAGPVVNNWSKGLWPHSYHLLTPFQLAPGKLAFDYQITDMGSELTLGTFCHENGHMICDFPDLYDYGSESNGVGFYCLMCAGGIIDPKNPTHIGAYLKYKAGWATELTKITGLLNATAAADKNSFFLLAKNASEYFIIENRNKTGRDASLPDAGLAIWHCDELGDNSNEQMTPASHYECSLMQADGKNDLEKRVNNGDANDLYDKTINKRFSNTTMPSSKWWDGTASKLEVFDIGPAGKNVKFSARI